MPSLPAHVFHIADAQNWAAIQRDGLLRTETLLKRAGHTSADAAARTYRPEGLTLDDGAFIRDQRPAPPAALSACLDPGIAPEDWYGLLNGSVFFWADADRVARHTRAQGKRPTVLMTFDTERLAAQYGPSAFVTPFNIGNARRRPAQRGWRTLVPIERWCADGWAAEAQAGAPRRPARTLPAELVVRDDVPDALAFMVDCQMSWKT